MTETLTSAPPAPAKARPKEGDGRRLDFLDWTRGLAATIMLQGHVFHSYMQSSGRNEGPYVLSQFIGGITPAIFLFLTGVTLAFLMDGRERKGAPGRERVTSALRRAGYLALLAVAFRVQLWLFGWPSSPASDLLKVDILNCMAAGIAALAGMALLTTRQRVRAGIAAGVVIAAASPLVSMLDIPGIAGMYLRPDPNYFSFFPWASFLAFGVGAGSIIRLVTAESMNRMMQWAAILGFGLILTGQYFSNLPYSIYPSVDFWLNSPGLIFIKMGVILLLLSLAFLWTSHGAGSGWSWVRTLGTNSLLVYWVHIELVYGRWLWFWKDSLTALQCAVVSVAVIGLMLALCHFRKQWKMPQLRFGSIWPTVPPPIVPRRASGD